MEHNTLNGAPDADVFDCRGQHAGLALASALSGAGLRCTIVEQQALPVLEAPGDDGREIGSDTPGAACAGFAWNLAALFPDGLISPMREARVLDGDSPGALVSSSIGDDALGWLVPGVESVVPRWCGPPATFGASALRRKGHIF